jgi:hypothetical protein
MKFVKMALITIVSAVILTSCGADGTGAVHHALKGADGELPIEVFQSGDGGYPITIRDYMKDETTLEAMPLRAAVISGTPLNVCVLSAEQL